MKLSLSSLGKSFTPLLLGLSCIVCSVKGSLAAESEGAGEISKSCPSKMTVDPANRVSADQLKLGFTNKVWTMEAGEWMIEMKGVDDELPYQAARVDLKKKDEKSYEATVGCSTFEDVEDENINFRSYFGILSFSDKDGVVTRAASIMINLMKKTSSLSALKLPREKPTMLSLLKKKRSFSEDSALVSQEIFKNSDSEILIRSRAQHTSFEEVSTITNQKFVLK